MSFNGVLKTSVSGMNAQASRLASGAENIANSDTTGYKRVSVEFSSLIPQSCTGHVSSGSVLTHVRNEISTQGTLEYTASVTDLAITGDGFFVVSDAAGSSTLTRAGAFVPNADGELVNSAGFFLMGYPVTNGVTASVANGYAGLERVSIFDVALNANATTSGELQVNYPSNAAIVAAADLPSANAVTAEFTGKTSLVTYDNLGNEVILDIYASKIATETWEVTVYNRADADPSGAFPYAAGPLSNDTLTFDPVTGALAGGSPNSLSIAVPNGQTVALDLSDASQFATDYTVLEATVNGNAPSSVELLEIGDDGLVYASYANGQRVATYQIPLATVQSPDRLRSVTGNVFQTTDDSGDVQIGIAGQAGFGSIVSGALEESTVDLANELTTVIEAQRGYTANSRVFQTGSELLDVLVNLAR